MTSHSSILGGSNAARLLACPASYAEQLKSPFTDNESVYAAEGTALHLAIANCIESRIAPEQLAGAMFYGHDITDEHVAVLERALAAKDALLDEYGGRKTFKVVAQEKMLSLPGVLGAFGSVDLIMASKTTIVVIDWKFGAGVPVKALYEDDSGEMLNPQLAFYAAAARGQYKRRFKGKAIICAVVQPRLDPPLTYTATSDAELDDYLESFRFAVLAALGRDAHRERGEHCRFATCKATCSLWTGPVIDLSVIDPTKAALKASVSVTDYGAFLDRAMYMAGIAETWADEIRRQAHVFLEDGGKIPGWKLTPKRGTRQWKDPAVVPAELRAIGATKDDMYTTPELLSVAQMEKALKKRNIELPGELHHMVSSGTTIAPADDPRPTASHGQVIADLREALKAL